MKICGSCKESKPVDMFGIRKASPDGLAHKCKSCQSIYDKARANAPHRVKARLEYQQTEQGRKASNEAKIRYTEKNAVKRGASQLVGNAVKAGRLIKPDSCECCGSKPSRLHGHHNDYAFPLSVRWLCPGCHSQWHKKNGEGANAH